MLKAVQLQLGTAGNANGTVTQINTGLGLTGGPITSTGTISLVATGVAAGMYGSANQVPQITLNAQGQATLAANVTITAAAIGAVANTVNVLPGTGLTGGGPLTGNVTISDAASGVIGATYGNATNIPQITVNSQGRVTLCANVAIAAITLGTSPVAPGGTLATANGMTLSNVTLQTITALSGQATSTSANGQSSMMIAPLGYINLQLNGSAVKVPYYSP